ncbi:DUF1778 domain-containing protein [Flammeovirga yaeyamensis]|nr:DUF1778 domain-containing protein [Flammeovirga yaeyamensis]
METQLPAEKKERYQKAAKIKGFSTLNNFIISVMDEKSDEIIEAHEQILQTERDKELFFKTLENPPESNEALKKAVQNIDTLL